jgi:glucosamine-6-phosphate deaminase
MDEFVGLKGDHPQSFRHYLRVHLLDQIAPPRAVHLLQAELNPVDETARYGELLAEKPVDLACLGIGENGHIGLNDPPSANFKESRLVKVVELDETCRSQQIHDGYFSCLEEVPTHALTLTVPALLGAREISGVIAGERKALAVHDTLLSPVSKDCPASILRRHPHAVLHLDPASASHLER